jgi:hypothetical protein
MLDDFEDLNTAKFLDEIEEEDTAPPPRARSRRRSSTRRFLGMTPIQLFIISIELFAMVCILGFFLMIVTEKMVLPL